MKISRITLQKIQKEWAELTEIMAAGKDLSTECECEILYRFGIACRHHLLRAFLKEIPLLKTLLHLRWWLGGGPITSTE